MRYVWMVRFAKAISASWLVAASVVGFAANARAFCRTTTSMVPAGYDPAVQGCWSQGKSVAWTPGRVSYSLSQAASKQVSLADATRIAHLAFDAWNKVACDGGVADVVAYDLGPVTAEAAATDCGLEVCDPTFHDPQHVIVFRDDAWPHSDPANTLALTTVTYGVSSATIFDADIEINSAQHSLSVQEPPSGDQVDLQAILTHEAGHFFGLAHAVDTAAIMYAFYRPGNVTLSPDDLDGMCTVYPHDFPEPVQGGCACATGGGPSGNWAWIGVLTVGSWVRRRRTRH